ncbi:MAG: xanthine dehydrogenase family protein subunit M [Desulfobacteraceae bacterium]|nr:xanthine dehydrogenase family protein subunit M [Desulfobacteraceae bacterium]
MLLPDFEYHRVASPSEAMEILAAHRGEGRILAGGTDLIVQMKQLHAQGEPCPRHLITMKDVTDLQSVNTTNGIIEIGANVTHRDAELSAFIKETLGALHDASSKVGSVQIRNVATISGNICSAAPCADTAAPLLALGATAKVLGPEGKREIDLREFWLGPRKTVLGQDEILTAIAIPKPPDDSASAYIKVTHRKAMDIATIGVAVFIRCTPDRRSVREARIALNTVAPTSIRADEAETVLKGAEIDERILNDAADMAAQNVSPRTSYRSTADYRREMVRVFVRRALQKALDRILDKETPA